MSMFATIYAHSLSGRPPSEWETLDEHADRVAGRARLFAGAFGASEWGDVLGRWHDIGKRSDEFQRYIRLGDPDAVEDEDAPGRVDHSSYGAQHAVTTVGKHFGQLLAFCIAGHHGSLPDAFAGDERTRGSTLQARLTKAVPAVCVLPEDQIEPKLDALFRANRRRPDGN